MNSFIKKYPNLTAYDSDGDKQYPNVSYLEQEDEVKWVGEDPTLIITKYNVTTTSTGTKLLGISSSNLSKVLKMWVDGVEQNPARWYTFSTTGEHIVKYKLENPNYTINDMFYSCQNLTEVSFNNNLTEINSGTCQSCSGLTGSVTIPSSVIKIENYVFWECSGLTSVIVEATTPPTLQNDVFYDTTCPIYVPAESVETYKAANNWSRYASRIQAIPTT